MKHSKFLENEGMLILDYLKKLELSNQLTTQPQQYLYFHLTHDLWLAHMQFHMRQFLTLRLKA